MSTKINGDVGLRHELQIKCELTRLKALLKETPMCDITHSGLCGQVNGLQWCLRDYSF